MPAALSEAFRSPTFDTSSYTRSSLESLKNPAYSYGDRYSGESGGGGPNIQHSSHVLQGTFQGQNSHVLQGGGNHSNSSGSSLIPLPKTDNDTLSLISSINSDRFNNEIEEIKKKYDIKEGFSDDSRCDLHIYHILSCSTCRKKLKKLLLDSDEKEDFIDRDDMDDLIRYKKLKKQRKHKKRVCDSDSETDEEYSSSGLNMNNLTNLLRNNNILAYVISGILIIMLLDLFRRVGR